VTERRFVVVGGGITGLTAAYRLLADAPGGGARSVTLLDERDRVGGVIRTERQGEFVIDGGPDSFLATKPQATQLCKELGLGDRLIDTRVENRRVYVRQDGALHPLPEGLMLAIPTRILPLARSRLISWRGKARMALDLMLPRRRAPGDESMGAFVARRLGREAVERLAEPLMGGIYAGDVETLSIGATFPQLVDLERRHGSLIRGALELRRKAGKNGPPSAFHSLVGGMSELTDALRSAIVERGGRIATGTRCLAVTRPRGGALAPPSPRLLVRVAGPGGEDTLPADELLMAVPAHAAADALGSLDAELERELRAIPYLSTATVALAYRRSDVPHPLDALGVIVPRGEARAAMAATFISSKWPHRAPEDAALLRVFFGGHRDPDALRHSDETLLALARDELGILLGIRAEPLLSRIFRYERANAQPLVGHAATVLGLRARASRVPGLHLAGAAYDGVGIPDCVRQATDAARAMLHTPG
jgi:oxygen-dependent protoporphyrinogen oxidase